MVTLMESMGMGLDMVHMMAVEEDSHMDLEHRSHMEFACYMDSCRHNRMEKMDNRMVMTEDSRMDNLHILGRP